MKKKIYKIKIDPTDQITGMDAISLVQCPAVEVFDRETIEQLVTKYSKYMFNNFVNIEHSNQHFVDGMYMIESYLKNSERGIVPVEFSEIPDGSWIVSYKVDNIDVWEKIKSGEVKGFSIQGVFNLIEQKEEPSIDDMIENDDIDGLLNAIK